MFHVKHSVGESRSKNAPTREKPGCRNATTSAYHRRFAKEPATINEHCAEVAPRHKKKAPMFHVKHRGGKAARQLNWAAIMGVPLQKSRLASMCASTDSIRPWRLAAKSLTEPERRRADKTTCSQNSHTDGALSHSALDKVSNVQAAHPHEAPGHVRLAAAALVRFAPFLLAVDALVLQREVSALSWAISSSDRQERISSAVLSFAATRFSATARPSSVSFTAYVRFSLTSSMVT